jgi:hypothetical protein
MKLTVALLLLSLLANNVLLAGALWIDQHEFASHIADSNAGTNAHDDHVTHCCHIQAHFQTLVVQHGFLTASSANSSWISQASDHLKSPAFSPPTPPPKA